MSRRARLLDSDLSNLTERGAKAWGAWMCRSCAKMARHERTCMAQHPAPSDPHEHRAAKHRNEQWGTAPPHSARRCAHQWREIHCR